MLHVRNLRKQFGTTVAVDDVSFTVDRGQLVGLLGPNGAGKTTTVSMIAGLINPDDGQVLIDGSPIRGDTDPRKRSVGLVPQDLALYDELSARENLRFFGALYALSGRALDIEIERVLALVGLLLVVLHGVEAAIWAAAYLWLGALGSPTDAVLYSVGAMTTAGSALTLAGHWRMVGALESAGGMLLFGISTAYMFAVMQVYWPMLYPPGHKKT